VAELDPAVITERVLRLGRAPPIGRLSTAELDVIASAGREVVCATRTLLVPAEERAPALFVALTGRIRVVRAGQPVSADPVWEFYGGTSLLSDSVIAADVVAEPGTVLFVLDRDVFFALLEEHGDLQRSLLRILSARVIELRAGEVVTSGSSAGTTHAGKASSNLLSRMGLLRDALGLESRSLPVLTQLARAAQTRHTLAGNPVWTLSEGPANVVVVVDGVLEVMRAGSVAKRVLPGEALGLAESVAAVPMVFQGMAPGDLTTIELTGSEMQEAMDDHDDFCQDLMRVMAFEVHRRTFEGLLVARA
jgi:CRP-like cAMP-binding protein